MPRVRLNFPNVLNTSVQVGDYAYFSNPRAVGPVREYPGETGLPSSGGTHTPHMTNDQSEIIMIGEILEVGEWLYEDNLPIRSHDTFAGRPPVPNAGFIICDMPQDLFNQYWDQIANGKCEQVMVQGPGAGDCVDPDTNFILDWPVVVGGNDNGAPQSYGNGLKIAVQNQGYNTSPPGPYWHFLPQNQNKVLKDWVYHTVVTDHNAQVGQPGFVFEQQIAGNLNQRCRVMPGQKNVNGIDDLVTQTSPYTAHNIIYPNQGTSYTATGDVVNYWMRWVRFRIDSIATHYFPNPVPQADIDFANNWNLQNTSLPAGQFPSYTVNDLLSYLSNGYPNDFNMNLGYNDIAFAHQVDPVTQQYFTRPFIIRVQGLQVSGDTGITYEENCVDPSYIMFSKDNKANMSSLVGYYASVELRNNSLDKAELFNVGSVFTESSK